MLRRDARHGRGGFVTLALKGPRGRIDPKPTPVTDPIDSSPFCATLFIFYQLCASRRWCMLEYLIVCATLLVQYRTEAWRYPSSIVPISLSSFFTSTHFYPSLLYNVTYITCTPLENNTSKFYAFYFHSSVFYASFPYDDDHDDNNNNDKCWRYSLVFITIVVVVVLSINFINFWWNLQYNVKNRMQISHVKWTISLF